MQVAASPPLATAVLQSVTNSDDEYGLSVFHIIDQVSAASNGSRHATWVAWHRAVFDTS